MSESESPRLHHCGCQPDETKTFSPLAELLPDHTTPELLFLETKWASLMSYGLTTQLLEDVLPMGEPLNAFTIRRHVWDVAERLEQELGEEQDCFIEGCQRDWDKLPAPDGPLTVGIDGGDVRPPKTGTIRGHCRQKHPRVQTRTRRETGTLRQVFRFRADLR